MVSPKPAITATTATAAQEPHEQCPTEARAETDDLHPPVLARMMPQPEARRKRKAKALAAKGDQREASSSEDESPATTPCPPPGSNNHSSKRKRTTRDVGIEESRRGTTTVRHDAPTSIPPRATYNWMTHQATPGPSGAQRGATPTYDLRRNAPPIGERPSLAGPYRYAQPSPPGTSHPILPAITSHTPRAESRTARLQGNIPAWAEHVETLSGLGGTAAEMPQHLHPSAMMPSPQTPFVPQPNYAEWTWIGNEPQHPSRYNTPWHGQQVRPTTP